MLVKILPLVHWLGFLASCFMLLMTFMDPSQDEVFIHLTASLIPNSGAWLFATILGGRRNFFPFISNN